MLGLVPFAFAFLLLSLPFVTSLSLFPFCAFHRCLVLFLKSLPFFRLFSFYSLPLTDALYTCMLTLSLGCLLLLSVAQTVECQALIAEAWEHHALKAVGRNGLTGTPRAKKRRRSCSFKVSKRVCCCVSEYAVCSLSLYYCS